MPAVTQHRSRLGALIDANVFSICVVGVLAGIQAQVVRSSVIGDAWYTLVSGRLIAHSGLPRHDVLTALTLGRRWVDQQWLGQLGLYGVWSAGGWPLAGAVIVLLYSGAFAIVAVTARRLLGASDRSVALVLLPCFLAGLPNTVYRTQLVAYPLFALVLALLLDDARRPSRRVLLVLPLLMLWANIHGSVVLGAALVALRGLTAAVAGERARAAALVLSPWPCTLASPYALHLPGYYRSVLDNPTLAHSLAEWAPTTLRGQPLFFAVLAATLILTVRAGRRLTSFAHLALWLTAGLGLLAVRNEVWLALAAAAVVPRALDGSWQPSAAARRPALNVALAGAVGALTVVLLAHGLAHSGSWYEHDYPPAAAAAAARVPGARVFANERYADWLLFREPALRGRVAFDVRFELLRRAELRSIVDFRTEHGVDWQGAAKGDGVLVLDPSDDKGAVRYYTALPGTTVLYRDTEAVVLRPPAQ